MYRTWLIPYLEDTLDAEQRRQVETRLAEDPDLAAEMELLRRAEPRLREVVTHLRQTEAVAVTRPAPLWPRLRARLDPPPLRPVRGPVFWWLGGACATGAALLAVLTLTPRTSPPHSDRQLVQQLRQAPRVVFHPDNATGTVVAARLKKQAVRMAMARHSVNPHIAAVLAKARPVPLPFAAQPVPLPLAARPVPPPFAPPLPKLSIAGKLPMPVMPPPFQMAQRQDEAQGATFSPSSAPRHSPLQDNLRAKAGPPFPVFDGAVAPAPKHSPPPAADRNESAVTSRVPAPIPSNKAADAAGTLEAAPPGAAPPTVASRAAEVSAGAALNDTGDALTPRQRLERTVTPPLYGTPAGAQEQQRLLQAARADGTLDALTGQIEQGPVDAAHAAAQQAVNGRLLAAIYEAAGDEERALAERRRVALLSTAVGEDWFELAQTEARLGNTASAQRAYAQALRAPGLPLSPAHRAVAHQNLP